MKFVHHVRGIHIHISWYKSYGHLLIYFKIDTGYVPNCTNIVIMESTLKKFGVSLSLDPIRLRFVHSVGGICIHILWYTSQNHLLIYFKIDTGSVPDFTNIVIVESTSKKFDVSLLLDPLRWRFFHCVFAEYTFTYYDIHLRITF